MRTRSRRHLLWIGFLAVPLTIASSCNRKTASTAFPGKTTPSPAAVSQYTPRPVPPSPTLPKGAPTRRPELPQ